MRDNRKNDRHTKIFLVVALETPMTLPFAVIRTSGVRRKTSKCREGNAGSALRIRRTRPVCEKFVGFERAAWLAGYCRLLASVSSRWGASTDPNVLASSYQLRAMAFSHEFP